MYKQTICWTWIFFCRLVKYVSARDLAEGWTQVGVSIPASAEVPEGRSEATVAGDRAEAERGARVEDSSRRSNLNRSIHL